MKKFQPLAQWLVASLSMLSVCSEAALQKDSSNSAESIEPVGLRPLNSPVDNLFARHSSHSSHASHRSSSGGSSGYYPATPDPTPAPRYIAPAPSPPPAPTYTPQPVYTPVPSPEPSHGYQPVDPGRPAAVSPHTTKITPATPTMSTAEKLRLQVMRVQLALLQLGIYNGEINGVLDTSTRESLKRFQIVKGYHSDGLMTTETLNALGVTASQ